MQYQAAVDYILSFTDYEKLPGSAYAAANFDLRRVEILLAGLGNPERCAPVVHVAGTKGKGSTSAMISSVLTASGRRTGLFTSPHLHDIRERIRIDGELISESDFAGATERLKPEIERVNRDARFGILTTFELLTALAFLYFRDRKIDYQVLEVGLGGRLDATNVVQPGVSVITPIGFDHMDILGHTLTKIAGEKAGIIKPGCVAVSAPQTVAAARVISRVCRENGVPLTRVGRDVTWEKLQSDLSGQRIRVTGRFGTRELWIPLLGDHQVENAATAVAALEALDKKNGVVIPDEILKQGMARVNWPARFQVLRQRPYLVVDGAHNRESALRLRESVQSYFPRSKVVLVLGASGDKDIKTIVEELAPICHTVIVTRANHPRAAATGLLVREFARHGLQAETSGSVAQAIARAGHMVAENDLILVAGSLFVAAEAIESQRARR